MNWNDRAMVVHNICYITCTSVLTLLILGEYLLSQLHEIQRCIAVLIRNAIGIPTLVVIQIYALEIS